MLKRRIAAVLMIMLVTLTGCSRIRFTTGLDKDTFARIDGQEIDMSTAMLLLGEMSYSYENLFNTGVWAESLGDVTVENYVKNSVRDTIEHVTVLKNMAEDMNILLTDDEKEKVGEAAGEYCSSVENDSDSFYDTVEQYYSWLLLAEKVFYAITDDVDTEVSTDEARIIEVKYIFFSTMEFDDENNLISLDNSMKRKKYNTAVATASKIDEGEDFATVAKTYSDDSNNSLELGRGEYNKEFENAAFELVSGEVSNIVETEYGYYIIKCVNDNVESDYKKQSEKVVLARRTELFKDYYIENAKGVVSEFNDKIWNKVDMKTVEKGNGQLYEIYSKYIISTQAY